MRYADYLKGVYSRNLLAPDDDKGLRTPGDVFIKLALVKKEQVSRDKADKFTRLTLTGDVDEILKEKQSILIKDVMTLDENINLVVVEGAPGIGKSTLAWELCRQWPTLQSMKRFSLVVLLRLREEGVQASKTISDLFPCPDIPGLSMSVGKKTGEQNGENVLFVFDGFDEFPAKFQKAECLIMRVIRGSSLPKATVLVTSRPSATRDLLTGCKSYKHIEVVGFSKDDIMKKAESVFKPGSELLDSFETYLSVNPIVKGLMYNPLNCGIVIDVFQNNKISKRPIPRTLTQLYTELCLCLLSRHLNAVEDPMADNVPDQLRDIPEPLHAQLVCLGQLAFEGRMKEQIMFNQLPEGCSELGLLNSCTELYGRKRKTYNFFHLTLQEYFGAFYISQLPGDRQLKLFAEYGELAHLNMVWRFLSGLTQMKGIGWEVFKNRKVNTSSNDYGYITRWNGKEVYIRPSVVQCLYEAQDADSLTKVFGQSRVEYVGYRCTTPFDAYAVGYCVSACKNSNAWYVDLGFNHLGPELVEMFVCAMKSFDCGSGFVEKLDLSINPINEGIVHLKKMPHQSLQRIKKIGLCYCQLTQTGFDTLADLIPLLPSLTELDICFNPGGNGSIVRLLEALGVHTTIECLDMRDIGIGDLDVHALSEVVKPSGSLKDLFVGSYLDRFCNEFSSETWQHLMRTVLSPSSLTRLWLEVHKSFSPLEHVETIIDRLSHLEMRSIELRVNELLIYAKVREVHTTAPSARTTSTAALTNVLKSNTKLKCLFLFIQK